jgi:hypothetical protein
MLLAAPMVTDVAPTAGTVVPELAGLTAIVMVTITGSFTARVK